MSKQEGWQSKIYAASILVIFVSLYGVRLGFAWVAVQLVIVTGPMLLLKYQDKDAKGRPIPAGERHRGRIGDLGFRYSPVGAKFAVSSSSTLGALLTLIKLAGWWPHLGVTTVSQDVVITISFVVGTSCLFAYVSRRWPDEPDV